MKGIFLAFKKRISAAAFTRLCWLLAALWFLGLYPFLAWTAPHGVLARMRMIPRPEESPIDFAQYYAGAFVAANGWWDCLYPVPRSDVYGVPARFEPVFKTFLWHGPAARTCDYPVLAMREASEYLPRLTEACPQLGSGSCRYFYPPPLAMLLRPLAAVGFDTAAYKVWPALSMAGLFALAFFSGRVGRFLIGTPCYTEGLIVLSVVFFSFGRGITHISSGNVGPILSGMVAFAAFAWLRGWQTGLGIAMLPLLLFKGIGLTWCPLLLVRAVQWRTLGWLAVLTAALNGAALYAGGVEVYRQFFETVLPKIVIPQGIGFVAGAHYYFGAYPKTLYFVVKLAVVLLLAFGYWRTRDWRAGGMAALAGLMALFCWLNNTVWLPYFPEYCFFPFLGWLAWECWQARGRWAVVLRGGTLFALAVITGDWIAKGGIYVLIGPESMAVYHSVVTLPCFTFILPVFVLAIALRRLLGGAGGVEAADSLRDSAAQLRRE